MTSINVHLTLDKPNECWGKAKVTFKEQDSSLEVYIHLDNLDDSASIQKAAKSLVANHKTVNLVGDNWTKLTTLAFNRGFRDVRNAVVVNNPAYLVEDINPILTNIEFVRDLINEHAETLVPVVLVDKISQKIIASAKKVGKEAAVKFEIIKGTDLKDQEINGIYTVGRGSANAPAYLKLDFNPTGDVNAPVAVALVGKGITYDTGGLDIKPNSGMIAMRSDMGGSALVAGALALAIEKGLNKRVQLYVASAENFISSTSYRPSDIISYRNGITVEVGNTDAEGRLVLADALIDASKEKPQLIIDAATLTGAAKAAVGADYHSVLSFDDNAVQKLFAKAAITQEPFWRLPLAEFHRVQTRGSFADLSNSVNVVQKAGASTAGAFLSYFVEDYKNNWIHIDASASFNRRGGDMALGATGIGVETLALVVLEA